MEIENNAKLDKSEDKETTSKNEIMEVEEVSEAEKEINKDAKSLKNKENENKELKQPTLHGYILRSKNKEKKNSESNSIEELIEFLENDANLKIDSTSTNFKTLKNKVIIFYTNNSY